MAGEKVEPAAEFNTETQIKDSKFNMYATKKTLAQGLLDIGLLMANASQLKTLIDVGAEQQPYFWPNLVLISLSVLLQIFVGIVFLILGSMEFKTADEKRRSHILNDITVGVIFAITVINVFIGAFGIQQAN